MEKGVERVELLQLQYFRTVARLEHMTRAAEELRIAQPALSKTIARLEEDLGVPLFDRHSRQIRLNAFGQAFLRKVETALSALDEGRREVADLAGAEKGIIRIATSSLGRISSAVGAFRALHPDVHFRVIQIAPASTEMAELLENGEADLCFSATPIARPGIGETAVLEAEVFLAVPKGHRWEGRSSIDLSEAENESFIEYREGHPFREINEAFCRQAGIERNVVCEVEEPSALESLVLAGLGVAFMPSCSGDSRSPLWLVRIERPVCRRTFTVAWWEKRYMSKAAQAFRSFLNDYFDEYQRGGSQS